MMLLVWALAHSFISATAQMQVSLEIYCQELYNYLQQVDLIHNTMVTSLLDFILKMELLKILDPMMVVPHKEFGALVEAVTMFQYIQLQQIIAVEQ